MIKSKIEIAAEIQATVRNNRAAVSLPHTEAGLVHGIASHTCRPKIDGLHRCHRPNVSSSEPPPNTPLMTNMKTNVVENFLENEKKIFGEKNFKSFFSSDNFDKSRYCSGFSPTYFTKHYFNQSNSDESHK
jgi:hypothetical protein